MVGAPAWPSDVLTLQLYCERCAQRVSHSPITGTLACCCLPAEPTLTGDRWHKLHVVLARRAAAHLTTDHKGLT